MKLYKVLVKGASCHGGKLVWSLPSMLKDVWTPGQWNAVEGKIELCLTGLHVTSNPSLWWKDGCIVYEAEVAGDCGGKDDTKSKFVYPRVRLLHQVKMINIGGGWKIEQDEMKSTGWSDPVKDK